MQGTMMNYPLTLPSVLERGGKLFSQVEIVSRQADRSLHRYTYADLYRRARALAEVLQKAGLRSGDRVATLMWNNYAHLEAYFGIPVAGSVLHTLNLRLAPHDLSYIVNHAGDRFLILDDVLLPLYEKFKGSVKLERVIVVRHNNEPLPDGYDDYEEFLRTATGDFHYPDLDENQAAAMCYTSGTTGFPKGVVYTHRSIILHSFMTALAGSLGLSQFNVLLPLVPMFHVNAWGLPFTATMVGAKQVLPGPCMDAESLLELCEKEKVTFSAGVPTIWLGVVDALEKHTGRWKLQPIRALIGGAAPPESLIRRLDCFGIQVVQGWGLTESSPIATTGELKVHMLDWPDDEKYPVRAKAGIPVPFIEMRAANNDGECPRDGKTMGEVQLRGPWIASSYYNSPEESQGRWTEDGWFRTGDVGTIDADGYLKISDRAKDLIKSGGEWISSVDLENAIVGHPDVKEAAVIAIPHPRWQERPVAIVVLRDGAKLTAEILLDFLAAKFAKWQLPESFVWVEELPHTSTGKLLKTELRKRYADWKWEE